MRPSLNSSALALTFLIAVAFSFGCSESPSQYKTTPPPQPERDKAVNPATQRDKAISNKDAGRLLGDKARVTTEEMDARVEKNTAAPIIYGKGAGNITFDTTYKEAQDILGKPRNVSGSQHLYSEGMVVYWRQDDPRVADTIFIIGGYQGKISFPSPWNDTMVSDMFSDAFTPGIENPADDPKAQNLLKSVYNHLENTDIDCLAEGKCRLFLNEGGSYVVFELPNAYFLFGNNERRVLAQISMFMTKEPGLFRNPIDLLTGKVQVPTRTINTDEKASLRATDYNPSSQFGLGQTFEEVQKASGFVVDAAIDSYASYYSLILGQGTEQYLVFEKTDYTSPRPLPTDRLTSIGVFAKYTQPLKFGSKFIQIEPNGIGGISFNAVDEIVVSNSVEKRNAKAALSQHVSEMTDEDPVSEYLRFITDAGFLTTKAPFLGRNVSLQRSFTENLFNYLKAQAAPILGSDWVSYARIDGQHDDRYSKQVSGTLFLLNPKTREGKSLSILINETSGDLDFYTGIFTNPFEKKTYFAGMNGMTAGQNHLMGFTLGESIYLADFTYSRKESTAYGDTAQQATIRYEDKELGVLVARGSYKSNSESSVVYETGLERNVTHQLVEVVEVDGATLGLNYVEEVEIDGKKWKKYEINTIESSALFGSVQDICGISEFDSKIGTYDEHFQRDFRKFPSQALKASRELKARLESEVLAGRTTEELSAGLTDKEKELMNYQGCPGVTPADSQATNLRRVYYFPNHNMKLTFSRRELIKVGIYKKPSPKKLN